MLGDFRFAIRVLRSHPAFTFVAALQPVLWAIGIQPSSALRNV
jgi:hypothetical protein